jgi:hypothetical protein
VTDGVETKIEPAEKIVAVKPNVPKISDSEIAALETVLNKSSIHLLEHNKFFLTPQKTLWRSKSICIREAKTSQWIAKYIELATDTPDSVR